ncbi:Disintegrin and metalloproteinase domain-containing protein 9 [Acropora cervicornis]|uniref:Disintegrin and metalloproteinase domain-containing protein 9 n=1 Tax=Acropora cervicornis TaxID=6130 RepID=A0AAD9PQ23_ACRCE|nr:Disintegrin and metalloproteinase domain-containing protein 9 [Acropora cervicornis]
MRAAKNRLLSAFVFCVVICFFTIAVGTLDGNQITYPERIDGKRPRSDLSTSGKEGHVRDVSYRLTAFDKDWTLDLKNNKKIISPSFAMRTFDENGLENIEEAVYDDCHYQGTIRGVKDSSVVLNTCKGLRGVLDDGKDTFYIAPVSGYKYGAHSVFQTKEQDSSDVYQGCGNEDVYTEYHVSGDTFGHFSTIRRGISNMDDFYRPYLTTNETRYNELVLVADHRMYLDYNNDTATIKDRVITLVNAVDAIYQRINIRIVLKALEIWTNGDPYEREIRGGPDLGKFNNYRNAHLQDKFPHDNAQLLSQWSWSDCAGMAFVRSMCGRHSAGVNRWSMSSIIGPYVTVAHEMGHNFGFNHDSGNCKCLTRRGCIMGGHK